MARGSGTLQVVAGDARVRLNDDSKWEPQEPRDVGRELFIDGAKYQVIAVLDGDGLQLDRS